MTLTTLALNGTPIEDLGLEISTLEGWHTIPERSYAKVALPLRRGNRVLTTGHTAAARTFAFRLAVTPSSVTDRSTRLDALAAQFAGLVAVTTADAPSRACYGLLQVMTVVGTGGPSFVLPEVYTDCTVICDDPLYYDLTAMITSITAGTRGALPQGTGPVRRMVVAVEGPCTDPVVILRDQTGAEAQRMTFSGGAVASDRSISIDCDAYTVSLEPDGTNLLQAGWLGASDTFFELRAPFTYTLECAEADLTVTTYRSWEN
jgi:hypothetical protein